MKKFKIIEKSRFLSNRDELNAKGGIRDFGDSICTTEVFYRSCTSSQAYKTCGVSAAGYSVNTCVEGGGSPWVTCEGVTYSSSCGGGFANVLCPGRYGGLN